MPDPVDVENIDHGDELTVADRRYRVLSIGKRVQPPEGIHRIGLHPEDIGGTASTLHVDRDPWELSICNGPTIEIGPDDIEHHA